ncbi:MAG: hypothetical protein B7733_26015 [Myxococcales bacterium FL481]|nr:MAG: hypothetical protein B7733_26015 [Myxococcales bacterium FL481]
MPFAWSRASIVAAGVSCLAAACSSSAPAPGSGRGGKAVAASGRASELKTASDRTRSGRADAPAPSSPSTDRSEPAAPPPTSNPFAFSEFVHVAGRGEVAEDDLNEWRREYEGARAPDVEFSHPYFVVADAAGHAFVADKEAHAVRRIAVDGTISTWLGTNRAGNGPDAVTSGRQVAVTLPNGLWLRDDGTLYVLDLGNGKIRRVDAAGQASTLATIPGGIDTGRGLWVADDEKTVYFAAKSALRRWTPNGVETLADGFVSLGNLVVDRDGSLLFTDRGGNRVYRRRPTGEVVSVAGNGTTAGGGHGHAANESGLAGPRGLAVVGDGHYVIATHRGRRLWGLDPQGRLALLHDGAVGAGAVVAAPGTIGVIRGLSRAPNGDLWLAHGDAGQIHTLRRGP